LGSAILCAFRNPAEQGPPMSLTQSSEPLRTCCAVGEPCVYPSRALDPLRGIGPVPVAREQLGGQA